ncbi:hypothetical protein AB6A40_010722 [Gnathostoma spinigerum]|uniref:Uncharacterized protein n=1 Tax=Gnathostoma spinigerum TaxID=75299 RepID=A0ABD6F2A1_9BILA
MRSFSALLFSIVFAFSWMMAEIAANCENGKEFKCFYDRCRCIQAKTAPAAETQHSGGMVATPPSIWSSILCSPLTFPPNIECLSRTI